MGNFWALLGLINNQKKDTRVLLLGLDNAGKTTLVKQLGLMKFYTKQQMNKEDQEELSNINETNPTVGFNIKEIQFKNLKFAVWDLGGQNSIRSLWKHYYKGTSGIIFVIDSSAIKRVDEGRQSLEILLGDEELQNVPLLVIGNKNDIPTAMKPHEIIAKFRLEEMIGKSRKWFVQSTSALNGDGVYAALEWLSNAIE